MLGRSRPVRRLVLAGALMLASSAAGAQEPVDLGRSASAPPELVVRFEEASVAASELTPGGEVVFFSMAREPQGYVQRVVRRIGWEVADRLGEARYAPEGGAVPLKSVWAVADVASGKFAVAAPAGFRLEEISFPGNAFEVGAPGVVNRLRHAFSTVDMLQVRPGVGAWFLRAYDAGSGDRDGADDDRVTTAPEDAVPVGPVLGAGPPPERFAADDVIVVINPRDLRFYAARLIGPPA